MPGKRARRTLDYDRSREVCDQFCSRLPSLFFLAHLMAGSMDRAEAILIRGVDLAIANQPAANPEYAYPMARRCVIKAGIEQLASEIKVSAAMERDETTIAVESDIGVLSHCERISCCVFAEAIWKISPFRRLVLLLRLFERYHPTDVALLLDQPLWLVSRSYVRGLGELCS